jgi:hypothetical protein
VEFSRKAIRVIGKVAVKLERAAEPAINVLLSLVEMNSGGSGTSGMGGGGGGSGSSSGAASTSAAFGGPSSSKESTGPGSLGSGPGNSY